MPVTPAARACNRRINSCWTSAHARGEGPEIDLDSPAVWRDVGAVHANERPEALDGRVLRSIADERLLPLGQALERHRLWSLRDANDYACVLDREEALRHDDQQRAVAHQRREETRAASPAAAR